VVHRAGANDPGACVRAAAKLEGIATVEMTEITWAAMHSAAGKFSQTKTGV